MIWNMEHGGLDYTKAPPCDSQWKCLHKYLALLNARFDWLVPKKKKIRNYRHLLEVHLLSKQARRAVAHLFCSFWLCGWKTRRFTWF